jgi:hypothetical protein
MEILDSVMMRFVTHTRGSFQWQSFLSMALLLAVGVSACASAGSNVRRRAQAQANHTVPTPSVTQTSASPTPAPTLYLPGQQTWKNGASSLLFGTNDGEEYYYNNLDTQPRFQQALKSAGVTLVRTFAQDPSTDQEIDSRIQAIEQIGAQCLVVIPRINDLAFNAHLVRYLGDRCLMYDFGNEPDWNDISVEKYSAAWNTEIPLLRKINPHALFFGPVISIPHIDFVKQFLVKAQAANNLPDAISIHWYTCYQDREDVCRARIGNLAVAIEQVRAVIYSVLGKELPIGVDEWNFDPSGPGPAYGNDPAWISQFIPSVIQQLVAEKVAFACQFDAASYAGFGTLDMFDVHTNEPKVQYYELAKQIAIYKPSDLRNPGQ